jgi:enoyl-CoA hydratase/carnithine racemase
MLQLDDSRPTAVLSLDHGKVNALDVEVLDALTARLAALAGAGCSALVLTGAGRAFSAGVDLFRVLEGGDSYARRLIPALGSAFEALFTFPKPVVAAVNGAAIAGGCVLACACDHRVAADTAAIGASELRVGVPFPASALEILRHACGPEVEAVVLGGPVVRGGDALARRLVDEVVPGDELLARALAVADDLATIPQPAYRMAKEQLRRPAIERIRAGEGGDGAVTDVWASAETADAIRASLARTTGKAG